MFSPETRLRPAGEQRVPMQGRRAQALSSPGGPLIGGRRRHKLPMAKGLGPHLYDWPDP